MTHAEMNGLYELYALGILEREEAASIDQHLAEECEYCAEHVREAFYGMSMLSVLAEPAEPGPHVRRRLLASVRPAHDEHGRPRKSFWAFPQWAVITACAALAVWGLYSIGQLAHVRANLERVAAERDELRSALEILSRSQTRTVQFGSSDSAAHGRVLVNPGGGFVFVGSDLPAIARDRVFELWLVPIQGAPRPAGIAAANDLQSLVHVSRVAVNSAEIKAVAVSIEPPGGSNTPTTTPFLVIPLG